MEPVESPTFLREAAAHGIGVDPAFARKWPRNLSFQGRPGGTRYWTPPEEVEALPAFIDAVLDGLGPWRCAVLWPKCVPFDAVLRNEEIEELARVADSLPALGSLGGVRFERADLPHLRSLVAAIIQHGWSWPTDVLILPDSFDVIVMVDHHDAVHASFARQDRCEVFVQHMGARGFQIADDRPDPTFKAKPDGSR
jgi:hypothetical protein